MIKKLIGELLIEKGYLTNEQLKRALDMQVIAGKRIGDILVELGYVSRDIIEDVCLQSPIDLNEIEIDKKILNIIPEDFCKRHVALPIRKDGNTLYVVMHDPLNFAVTDEIKLIAKCELELIACSKNEILEAINRNYKSEKPGKIFFDYDESFHKEILQLAESVTEGDVDSAPISKLVSILIKEAFQRRASDIHIEPLRKSFRIRYRIDGVLHEIISPPKKLQGAIISRVKLMAGMDLSEKRLPQDGRIKLNIEGNDIDFRVSSLPGVHGESVVLRILDKGSMLLNLHELGLDAADEKEFEKLLNLPNGVILVTGPTGSGKTTTLYTALNYINRPDRKIITVEDPVEYQLTGINQVQVKEKINLTFANVLRSILRQAPEIIMIGEIRDYETAAITMQASLTGHLVFSTLHTNDAAGAVVRLMDMGVAPYLVSSAVHAVVAQRLVRRICEDCKEVYVPSEFEIISLGFDLKKKFPKVYKGKGCSKCSNTGYLGRIAIFEILKIDDIIRELIFAGSLSAEIRERAHDAGMKTLREDGIEKVFNGITTLDEILRVTYLEV